MTDQCGPDRALASLSARQAKAQGLLTSGTCGPHGITLSRMVSDQITLSLGSKLRAKQGGLGSILYRQTWKYWITDAGRLIPAQRALAHRSSGKDCIGWPRPTTRDHKDGSPQNEAGVPINSLLGRSVWLAGWPRPTVGNVNNSRVSDPLTYSEKHMNRQGSGTDLAIIAQALTGWPSPQAGNPGTETYNQAGNTDSSRKTQAIAMTVEYRFIPSNTGEMPTGSCVVIPTERVSGPLNPTHSLWLMLGPFATAWARCAERVTLSTSRNRRALSKR